VDFLFNSAARVAGVVWCLSPHTLGLPRLPARRTSHRTVADARGARFQWRWFACAWVLLATAFAAEPSSVRVVSQTVGTDELLLAVAAPEQIAALSHIARDPSFSAVADEARKYPALVLGDAETVLRYNPTLVLAADYSRPELIEQIRRAGVRVVTFDRYATLEDAFANLRLLGRELGPAAEKRAEHVITDYKQRVLRLAERLRGVRPVRVIAPSTYGVIPGSDTTFQDLCDHSAAVNLAATLAGLHGHQAPPNEQMLAWPIDKVVLAGASLDAALEPLRGISPYQFLGAVRERRVALLAPYMLSCVSHHRVEGYERLARELHPEVFP
jgi:iron complex transport system substrate-binding protein